MSLASDLFKILQSSWNSKKNLKETCDRLTDTGAKYIYFPAPISVSDESGQQIYISPKICMYITSNVK